MKVSILGSRLTPDLAQQAREAGLGQGWTIPDPFAVDDLRISGELSDADALAAQKRTLDEADGGIVVEPADLAGRAAAAYLAGRGVPLIIWEARENLDPGKTALLHQLLGQWTTSRLEQAVGWLRELLEGIARGREQADAE